MFKFRVKLKSGAYLGEVDAKDRRTAERKAAQKFGKFGKIKLGASQVKKER